MQINDNTFDALSTALRQLKLPQVDRTEAQQLIDCLGQPELRRLAAGARAGDQAARGQINGVILAIKSHAYITGTFPQATLDVVVEAVREHGYGQVRSAMVAAIEDRDVNAIAVLKRQLKLDQDEAMYPTDLGPPAAQQQRVGQPDPDDDFDDGFEPETPPSRNDGRGERTRAPDGSNGGHGTQSQARIQARRSSNDGHVRTPAVRGFSNVSYLDPRHQEDDVLDRDLPTSSANGPASNSGQPRDYDQHTCYGKDVAVQFERSLNKSRRVTTINLKIAKAKGATCKGGVDWNNAIKIMLEPHEVQLVYAVLIGIGKNFRAAGHGTDNQKWFEIQETTEQFAGPLRLSVGHGQKRMSVNIGYSDAKEVMELFSRALCDQSKGQDQALMIPELRRVYDLYSKSMAARASRDGGQHRSGQGGRAP